MSLAGKTLCFTGTLSVKRADAKAEAEAAGASVASSVTKKVEIIVAGANTGQSKISAAQKNGVEIWSEQDFRDAVSGGAKKPAKRKPEPKKAAVGKRKPAPKRKAAPAAKRARGGKGKAKAAAADSEDDDGMDDEDDDEDTPAAKPAAASPKRKVGLAGQAAPSLAPGATPTAGMMDIDAGLATADPELAKAASLVRGCKLTQVEPAKNTDKYYILQLLVDGCSGGYAVFSRWGRTGTAGQCAVAVHTSQADADADFDKSYKAKTGRAWAKQQVGAKPLKGKYQHLCLTTAASAGPAGRWEYYLTRDPLGKADGWYAYDDAANEMTEELWQEMQDNPGCGKRYVTANNGFTYEVDLDAGIQTNTKSGTSRPIKRTIGKSTAKKPATGGGGGGSLTTTFVVPQAASAAPAPAPAPAAKKAKKAKPAQKQPVATGSGGGGSKAGGTVDKHAPSSLLKGTIHDGFDAMLNQTNIVDANNNKFIKVQIIRSGGRFNVWKRWGRVGAVGQTKDEAFDDASSAEKEFTKYFKSKTGNNWEERDAFVSKAKKYTMVEIEHDADVAAAQNAAAADGEEALGPQLPCTLDGATQELVSLIFDEDMFKSAMKDMKLDPKKLPLGALSKRQLDKGDEALEALETAIKKRPHDTSEIGRLTGVFYSIIPHNFGRQRADAISTLEQVKAKYDMIATLRDIDAANQMTTRSKAKKSKAKGKGAAPAPRPHPADAQYSELNATLTLMGVSDPDYNIIQTYLKQTARPFLGRSPNSQILGSAQPASQWGNHYRDRLRAVWRVDRHGEAAAFGAAHGSLENRWLLWHGTNVAVVAAILKSGLRIMPHSGGRVGRGIYLADCQAKSASYTRPTTPGRGSYEDRIRAFYEKHCPEKAGNAAKVALKYQGREKELFTSLYKRYDVDASEQRDPGSRLGIMFLVEAPIGRAFEVKRDGAASSFTAPPPGFDSVVAKGRFGPQHNFPTAPGSGVGDDSPHAELVLDGKRVRVPQGEMIATAHGSESSFDHNEILVYREDQHRIRYVVLIDWDDTDL